MSEEGAVGIGIDGSEGAARLAALRISGVGFEPLFDADLATGNVSLVGLYGQRLLLGAFGKALVVDVSEPGTPKLRALYPFP